jgi:hypothetical protein
VDVLTGLVAAAVLIPMGNWLYFKFSKRDPERAVDRQRPAQR